MKKIPALAATALVATAAHAEYKTIAEVTIKVVTGAAQHEGEHRVATESNVCSVGKMKPGTWWTFINEQVDRGPKKLHNVQVILPDAKVAAGGTNQFFLAVGFGPTGNTSARYVVDTRDPAVRKGGGTVTLQDSGKAAKVIFSGITQDGVKLEGTVECKEVERI